MVSDHASSGTRILLVEDEAIIAMDLRQRLESLGYEVTGIAVNGEEALALAETTRPTLVFMDITIQGPIDGIETAKVLTSRMDVPVVFLTAHADSTTIARAKAARPYGYLVKPFEERELATTIEMAVYRHKSESEARLLQHAPGFALARTQDQELLLELAAALDDGARERHHVVRRIRRERELGEFSARAASRGPANSVGGAYGRSAGVLDLDREPCAVAVRLEAIGLPDPDCADLGRELELIITRLGDRVCQVRQIPVAELEEWRRERELLRVRRERDPGTAR